jgi:hypothetical protein
MVYLRRNARSLLGLEWRGFCPCSTSRSVGQALPDDTLYGAIRARHVINAKPDSIGVAEIEFGKVPVQVGFAHVLVDAVDAAFDDREISLDGVGVVVIPDVFLGRAIRDTMAGVESARDAVDWRLVALEPAVGAGVLGDDRPQVAAVTFGTWKLRTPPPRWTRAKTACLTPGGS